MNRAYNAVNTIARGPYLGLLSYWRSNHESPPATYESDMKLLIVGVEKAIEDARAEFLSSGKLGCRPEVAGANFDFQVTQQMPLYCVMASQRPAREAAGRNG